MNNANTHSDQAPVVDAARIREVLRQVYAWSRKRKYRGYNKHDGLNSPVLRLFLGWSKWPRLVAIQGVMRFPVNIRPLLLVKRSPNPKGLALFVQGLLYQHIHYKDEQCLLEAEKLLDELVRLKSPGNWQGICWGYHYPWQDLGFYAKPKTPNAVVSCFVCEAFLDAYEITGKQKYLDVVENAIYFLLNDVIRLKDTDDELCLSYMPVDMTMRVMDVSILIGSVLARFSQYTNNDAYLVYATRLVHYVVNQQTDEGAWYYTDPPDDSPVKHDNYHTGFILDALHRYMEATDHREWQHVYDKGLQFYADRLFNADGSPRWMSHRDYPHDIHGAAQGIITFSRHEDTHGELLNRILHWTLETLYDDSGRFYYQQTRRRIKKFTLMRWCNGWMSRALAEWLLHQGDTD